MLSDIQSFIIREIESIITSLCNGEDCYQTLITVYVSRYEKKIIENYMLKYSNIRNLKTKIKNIWKFYSLLWK